MKYKIISISLDTIASQQLPLRLSELGMSRSEYVRHLIRQDARPLKAKSKRKAA